MSVNPSLQKITLIGLFSALGVVLGFALAAVPNVELVSATIYIAGHLLGIQGGILVGLLTEGIYSFLNPYGVAPFPIFISQCISMMLIGFCGGINKKWITYRFIRDYIFTGINGFVLTLLFAIITTLGYMVSINASLQMALSSLVTGLGMYAIHLLSNTLIFLLIVPVVTSRLSKLIKVQ